MSGMFIGGSNILKAKQRYTGLELSTLASNPVIIAEPNAICAPIAASLQIFDATTALDYSGLDLYISQLPTLMQCNPAAVVIPNGFYAFFIPSIGQWPQTVNPNNPLVLSASGDSLTTGDGYGVLTLYYYVI